MSGIQPVPIDPAEQERLTRRARSAATTSVVLMSVQILPYLIITAIVFSGSREPLEALFPATPGLVFLLLAFFVWEHRAKAVDITAYLVTAQCAILSCVIFIAMSNSNLFLAAAALAWLISGIGLVARLYTFQRILHPPAPKPASAFPVIMPPAPVLPVADPPKRTTGGEQPVEPGVGS